MKERIKSCALCGGKRVAIHRAGNNACWVKCLRWSCGMETNPYPTRAGAILRWNRRSIPFTIAKVIVDDEKK